MEEGKGELFQIFGKEWVAFQKKGDAKRLEADFQNPGRLFHFFGKQ
jgi:hypothetical protein